MIGCENKEVPAPKYDDVMNVKLLLKEICQFLDIANCENSNMAGQIRHLASKVLFALSVNNFNAVFSRISGRLQARFYIESFKEFVLSKFENNQSL